MPDLVTHTLAAYAAGRAWGSRNTAGLVATGAILPDLLSHVPSKLVGVARDPLALPREAAFLFSPFHSTLMLIPVCLLAAFFFREAIRRHVFLCLIAGAALHNFMDLFQRQVNGGYMVWFPLSSRRFQFALVWGDYWMYWIPPLLVVAFIVEGLKMRRERLRR